MCQDGSFDAFVARLRQRDPEAATQLFQHFAYRLIGLARLHLDALLRQKVDAEDVVQSVFKSFFPRQAEGQFQLESWDGLWSLLALITLRKCHRQHQHYYGPVHDVRKEVAGALPEDDANASWQQLDREPSPEEAACLTDTLQCLMSGLDDRQRTILELRLQGYTIAEISERVHRTEYSVEGVLKTIRKELHRALESP